MKLRRSYRSWRSILYLTNKAVARLDDLNCTLITVRASVALVTNVYHAIKDINGVRVPPKKREKLKPASVSSRENQHDRDHAHASPEIVIGISIPVGAYSFRYKL